MDDIWGNESLSNLEWNKIDNDFTTAGYREGITAGKESSLQEGFDSGFAQIGVPLGHNLGNLRGIASALLSYLSSSSHSSLDPTVLDQARNISRALSEIRFTDIAPRDLEAEEHALEHLADQDDDYDGAEESEELAQKRKIERLEDELAKLSSGPGLNSVRPTAQDVDILSKELDDLCAKVGLNMS
ncbi:hypothetical protein DL96DRAFT_1670793 [Flagelloscypha sp. PMI_526]|nr:hypothetical protein DL96DRAFT_1670793 [Flagelloscypha sp. PMI_526]